MFSSQNRIPLKSTATDHKEGEQLEERRNVGENSCNYGDGADQTGSTLDVYDDDDDDDDALILTARSKTFTSI